MTKEERLLRQEQRERAKAIEAAAREAGRGPLDLPYLLLVLTLVGVGLIMLFSASFPSAYYEEGNPAYYLIRQGIFAVVGIAAMSIVGKTNYERYPRRRRSIAADRFHHSAGARSDPGRRHGPTDARRAALDPYRPPPVPAV